MRKIPYCSTETCVALLGFEFSRASRKSLEKARICVVLCHQYGVLGPNLTGYKWLRGTQDVFQLPTCVSHRKGNFLFFRVETGWNKYHIGLKKPRFFIDVAKVVRSAYEIKMRDTTWSRTHIMLGQVCYLISQYNTILYSPDWAKPSLH